MSENNPELDALNHLLEIEKQANSLIDEASIESSKRLSNAKKEYNQKFSYEYDKINNQLEENFKIESEKIIKEYQNIIEEYKNKIISKKQDYNAFSQLLEKLIFA